MNVPWCGKPKQALRFCSAMFQLPWLAPAALLSTLNLAFFEIFPPWFGFFCIYKVGKASNTRNTGHKCSFRPPHPPQHQRTSRLWNNTIKNVVKWSLLEERGAKPASEVVNWCNRAQGALENSYGSSQQPVVRRLRRSVTRRMEISCGWWRLPAQLAAICVTTTLRH